MAESFDNYDNLEALLSEAIAATGPDLSARFESDPWAYLELVVRTERAHQRTGEMLRAAVLAARAAGHSWDAIGKALGMSRQAAQQRFGRTDSPVEEGGRAPQWRLTGLSAFNEMDVLAKAGRYGWHSVGYGPFFHMLERDALQWEHRRVYAWTTSRAMLEDEGWQMVGRGWFPWAYYTRATGIPALEDDITDAKLLGK